MLLHLHVKNFALIDEIEVDFNKGLNIITGETGAGKSIILGSINIALGEKVSSDIIRQGAQYALVELIFKLDDVGQIEEIRNLDIPIDEDDCIIIQRKIYPGKSVCKVCGEAVTVKQLKSIAEIIIDIYGQHDYQSLLKADGQLSLLDSFCKDELKDKFEKLKEIRSIISKLEAEYDSLNIDNEMLERELYFAKDAILQIENANLSVDEEADVEHRLKRMQNAEKITGAVCNTLNFLKNSDENVADLLSHSIRELNSAVREDDSLSDYVGRLDEIESLMSELIEDITSYSEELEFSEYEYNELLKRFDLINELEKKYGKTIEDVIKYKEDRESFVEKMENSSVIKINLETEIQKMNEKLIELCDSITSVRKKEAKLLQAAIEESIKDLNFMNSKFEIAFDITNNITNKGRDSVVFNISTNIGENLRPLTTVASGGELSRIMLGIKTVTAQNERINTLIFDEIDSGISGKTAWAVSKKLGKLSKNYQIICITHLPQIAAMSDTHYMISKSEKEGKTVTDITELNSEQILEEMSRLLGGEVTNDIVNANAKELITQAKTYKDKL